MSLSLLLVGAGCDDSGRNLGTAAPMADKTYVGTTKTAPTVDQYTPTPDSNELSLDFGLVDVFTTGQRFVFIHNGGKSSLKLSKFQWQDPSSANFSVACLEGGIFKEGCDYSATAWLEVEPGKDLVIQVNYSPQVVGKDAGGFVIGTNAVDHPDLTIKLSGEAVTPEIEVCVSDCVGAQDGAGCTAATEVCTGAAPRLTLDFGDATVVDRFARKVTIRNKGNRQLQISKFQIEGGGSNQFELDKNGNTLPGVLETGAAIETFVTFAPATGGNHTATLAILSNDAAHRDIGVNLIGRGMAPRVCPDPLVLDFGNVAAGAPKVMSFSIKNCGLLDLELKDLALSASSSADFSLPGKPALPQTLAPDQVLVVEVQYLPPVQGSDDGGVDIFSNDPLSDPNNNYYTGTVGLVGDSIPRACDIQATPYAVNFGGVIVGTPQEVDLVISNLGSDTCTLFDVTVAQNSADNEFSILTEPAASIDFDPGDTLTARLQYLPIALGADAGKLHLLGTDKDGTVEVNLSGEGVNDAACTIAITPMSLRFGTVKLNRSQVMSIKLTNSGHAVCNITTLELEKSMIYGSDFAITKAPAVPFQINKAGLPNSSVDIEVTFEPAVVNFHKGAVHVISDDPVFMDTGPNLIYCNLNPVPGEACVGLSGFSAASEIEVVPGDLDFGVVTVGCRSPELKVTVYNLGTTAINIDKIYLEGDPVPDPNFQITSAPMVPLALVGGANIEIKLRYHPQDDSIHRSNLYIHSDASNVETLAVPLFGRGTTISEQTDLFHQPDKVKSDVLFVIDNSGSMGFAQQALADNFSEFIRWSTTLSVDFQIGVTTTEVTSSDASLGDPARPVDPGVLMQTPSSPKIMTNATPNLAQAFAAAVNVGPCCSDEKESGSEAAWMALSEPNITDPAKNKGFLREDAKLYIVALSDEQDQSKGNPDFYVDFFSSIKGPRNRDMMKYSAIVVPNVSPVPCGTEPGTKYIEIANRTGGINESICTNSWAQSLSNLGIDAFAAIREFPLTRPADPGTITVSVDGSAVPKASCQDCDACPDGWTYYPETNSICFGANVVPGRGETIEVHYTATCAP